MRRLCHIRPSAGTSKTEVRGWECFCVEDGQRAHPRRWLEPGDRTGGLHICCGDGGNAGVICATYRCTCLSRGIQETQARSEALKIGRSGFLRDARDTRWKGEWGGRKSTGVGRGIFFQGTILPETNANKWIFLPESWLNQILLFWRLIVPFGVSEKYSTENWCRITRTTPGPVAKTRGCDKHTLPFFTIIELW